LRLAVFDFDQTLSTCHLFHALVGGADGGGLRLPPPFAGTERGQLARLAELDELPEHRDTGFAVVVFGGHERLAQLTSFLEELRHADVECVVCSRGIAAAIRRTLDRVGLLNYFSQVIARVTTTQPTEYDSSLPRHLPAMEDLRYLSTPSSPRCGASKGRIVSQLLRERGVDRSEAVFLDDTQAEIRNVQPVCHAIQVQPPGARARGLGLREFDLVRQLAGLPAPQAPAPEHLPPPCEALLEAPQALGLERGASPGLSGRPSQARPGPLRVPSGKAESRSASPPGLSPFPGSRSPCPWASPPCAQTPSRNLPGRRALVTPLASPRSRASSGSEPGPRPADRGLRPCAIAT